MADAELYTLSLHDALPISGGFTVRRFDKGEDFITYVASHDVPLVVLDIWMEEMTGLEVLARLRAISRQTHVIVITGRSEDRRGGKANQTETVAYVNKAYDDAQFLVVSHR